MNNYCRYDHDIEYTQVLLLLSQNLISNLYRCSIIVMWFIDKNLWSNEMCVVDLAAVGRAVVRLGRAAQTCASSQVKSNMRILTPSN